MSRLYNLLFVFCLCFSCFLAGWLTAIYILPGNLSQKNLQELKMNVQNTEQTDSSLDSNEQNPPIKISEKKSGDTAIPFFEEMKNNIMLLFDPYKIDSVVKKHTHLEKEGNPNSPFKKKTHTQIPLKIQQPARVNNIKPSQNFNKPEKPAKPASPELAPPENHPQTQQEKETEGLQKLQAKYDEKNREQLLQILEGQKFFTLAGKFSFLVNVFSEEEKALKYVKNMKKQYPLWSFLIKAHKDHIRIYLGPFESKEKALEFKKIIPPPTPFSQDFLEEASL